MKQTQISLSGSFEDVRKELNKYLSRGYRVANLITEPIATNCKISKSNLIVILEIPRAE